MKLIEFIMNDDLTIGYVQGSDYLVSSDYQENYLNVYVPKDLGINIVTVSYQRNDGKKLGEYQLDLVAAAAENNEDNTLDKWGCYIDTDPRVLAISGQLQVTLRLKVYDSTSKLTSIKATPSCTFTVRDVVPSSDEELTEVEALTQVVSNTLESYKSTVNSNTTRIAQNEVDIEELKEDVSEHATSLYNHSTQLNALNTSVANNKTNIADLNTKVTVLETGHNTNATSIADLSDTVSKNTEKIGANTSDISGLKTRMTTAEGNIDTHSSNISDIYTKIANIGTATDISTLKTDVATLKTQVASFKSFSTVAVGLNEEGYPDVENPNEHTIYLTPKSTEDEGNEKDEWVYTTDGEWEKVGATTVDLSGYQTKEEASTEHEAINTSIETLQGSVYAKATVDSMVSSKQDKLTTAQLSAVNSGITSEYVAGIEANTTARHTHSNKSALDTIDATQIQTWNGYAAQILGKQSSLSDEQLAACNSGITSSLVASLQELLDNGNAENLEV